MCRNGPFHVKLWSDGCHPQPGVTGLLSTNRFSFRGFLSVKRIFELSQNIHWYLEKPIFVIFRLDSIYVIYFSNMSLSSKAYVSNPLICFIMLWLFPLCLYYGLTRLFLMCYLVSFVSFSTCCYCWSWFFVLNPLKLKSLYRLWLILSVDNRKSWLYVVYSDHDVTKTFSLFYARNSEWRIVRMDEKIWTNYCEENKYSNM